MLVSHLTATDGTLPTEPPLTNQTETSHGDAVAVIEIIVTMGVLLLGLGGAAREDINVAVCWDVLQCARRRVVHRERERERERCQEVVAV